MLVVLSTTSPIPETCKWQGSSVIFHALSTTNYLFEKIIINSLALGKFEWNFRYVIFKQFLVIDGWGISCEIALIWMSLDFTDDQSTLVQVMAWCHQATSHYLSQCWPRSLSPYGVTRPQWVNSRHTEFISRNIKTHLHFLSFVITWRWHR